MFIKTTIAIFLTLLSTGQLWAQSFFLGTYVRAMGASGGDNNEQAMQGPGKLADLISRGGAMAYSMAEAVPGVLRASSTTQAATGDEFTYVNGYGSAFAAFADSMQVDLLREEVTSGLLTIQLAVSGTVSSNERSAIPPGSDIPIGSNSAWAIAGIRFSNLSDTGSPFPLDLSIDAFNGETTTVPHGTIFDVEIPFASGVPLHFNVSLNILSNSSVTRPGSVSSLANFGGTVYWGGINSVVVDGVTLDSSEYNISSGSGTDYTKSFAPIPEPEIYAAIFGLGLAAFGILRRRTHRTLQDASPSPPSR